MEKQTYKYLHIQLQNNHNFISDSIHKTRRAAYEIICEKLYYKHLEATTIFSKYPDDQDKSC